MSTGVCDELITSEEESMEPKVNIKNFKLEEYQEFLQYLPEEAQGTVRDMLSTRRYGWQIQARLLARAKRAYESFQKNIEKLSSKALTPPRPKGRAAHNQKLSPRDYFRQTLNRMSDSQLRQAAEQTSVSYLSFMHQNDLAGLIEAILDEMLMH